MALAGDPALRFAPDATRVSAAAAAYVAADCRDRARPLLDRCYETIRRSRATDLIRRSLLKVSDRSMDADIEDVLEALHRADERVLDAAWTAVELLHEAVGYQRWRAPDRVMERLEKAVERWDETYIEVCGLVPGIDMYNALHAFRQLDEFSTEGSCPRCGSRLSASRYGDPSHADPQRIAVSCWQCGPVQESTQLGPALAITVSGTHEPGGTIRPRLSVRAAPGEQNRPGRLAIVLQDRVTNRNIAVLRAHCTLATLPEVSMVIPAETRSDLHFLWAVWASEMTVAFAHTRTPVIRPIH
jgi:hypothetical protein